MIIHDDFWEAAQAMPEKQRAAFIYAICEYRFTGKEPEGTPAWLPTFLVIKKRIELSDEASEKARKKARTRWSKKNATASNNSDAVANAQQMHSTCTAQNKPNATAYAAASNNSDAEGEGEGEYINNPYIPFSEIINHLNEKAGTSYKASSKKTRSLIRARFNDGFTINDFNSVIDTMCAEWQNDPKMCVYLRPETLFGTKFESYLNRKSSTKAKESKYAEYA